MEKGCFTGTQTNLKFIPAHHTDFIFSVVGEELGFLGAVILLALFALLLWRAFKIALTARDPFGTMLAVGIVVMFFFQILVNVGMTMGIMPITGIHVAVHELRGQLAPSQLLLCRPTAEHRDAAFPAGVT